jgi:hypothetical protein
MHLTSQGIPNKDFPLLQYHGLTDPPGSLGQTYLGLFVPMEGVPYFEEGETPNPGSLVLGGNAQAYPPP